MSVLGTIIFDKLTFFINKGGLIQKDGLKIVSLRHATLRVCLLPFILCLCSFFSLPLHIARVIRAASFQRDDMVNHISRTRTFRFPGGWTGLRFLKIPLCLWTSLDSGVNVERKRERKKKDQCGKEQGYPSRVFEEACFFLLTILKRHPCHQCAYQILSYFLCNKNQRDTEYFQEIYFDPTAYAILCN